MRINIQPERPWRVPRDRPFTHAANAHPKLREAIAAAVRYGTTAAGAMLNALVPFNMRHT